MGSMNKFAAARILNIRGETNPKHTKAQYRRACRKFHPDRNAGGTEMMKSVNLAYEVLKGYTGWVGGEDPDKQKSAENGAGDDTTAYSEDYGQSMMNALNAIINLEGITIEIMGDWIWVTGNTKPHKDKLGKKGAGFFWAKKKQAWYFRPPEFKSRSKGDLSLDEIRTKHGSKTVKRTQCNYYPKPV